MNLFRYITPQFAAALAFALAVVAPLIVWADELVHNGAQGEVMTLYVAKCSNDTVLAQIPPEYHDMLQQGLYKDKDGKTHANCWLLHTEAGAVLFLYEDGETGVVPAGLFEAQTPTYATPGQPGPGLRHRVRP